MARSKIALVGAGQIGGTLALLAGMKELTPHDLANPTAPMPTAIPETQQAPIHEPDRDGLSR